LLHVMGLGVANQNNPAQQPSFPQSQQVAQSPSTIQAHTQTQQAFSQQAQQFHTPDASSLTSPQYLSQYRSATLMSNQTVANNTVAATSAATPSQTAFTPAQLATLKYQILAFKFISKNMSVPPNLQHAVFFPANVDNILATKEQTPTVQSKIVD